MGRLTKNFLKKALSYLGMRKVWGWSLTKNLPSDDTSISTSTKRDNKTCFNKFHYCSKNLLTFQKNKWNSWKGFYLKNLGKNVGAMGTSSKNYIDAFGTFKKIEQNLQNWYKNVENFYCEKCAVNSFKTFKKFTKKVVRELLIILLYKTFKFVSLFGFLNVFLNYWPYLLLMSVTSWLLSSRPLKSGILLYDLDQPDLKGKDYE
jgi:hypothetical protein